MEPSCRPPYVFGLLPRRKEDLVVTGAEGAFILDMPMGVPTVYLPTEAAWRCKAPVWAHELWSVLRAELEDWCRASHMQLRVEDKAGVYPL